MQTLSERVTFFRHAFLRHAPRRHAVMLRPPAARSFGQKYLTRHEPISDALIARHLAGTIALAAPAAVDEQAYLLPLDIDAGGIAAIHALIEAATRRQLWAFGQYCERPRLTAAEQRGYVWLPFDCSVAMSRVQALGFELIATLNQPTWKIEARAHHAATRLPLARHTHTARFGVLIVGQRCLDIDENPPDALVELSRAYQENASAVLPAQPSCSAQVDITPQGQPISIARFNAEQDLVQLLEHYGALRARGGTRLYSCPFHDDAHASLSVYLYSGQWYCRCFSAHSNCPLSTRANDAFAVYCIGEQIDAREAMERIRGRG